MSGKFGHYLHIPIFGHRRTSYSLEKTTRWLIISLIPIFLAACSFGPTKTYEGEERKIEEVAVIVNGLSSTDISFHMKRGWVRLKEIDGIRGGSTHTDKDYHSSVPWPDAPLNVAVLPGERKLFTTYLGWEKHTCLTHPRNNVTGDCDAWYGGNSTFQFSAARGHTYLLSFVQFTHRDDDWTPVLIDTTDQRQVFPVEPIAEITRTRGRYILGPGIKSLLDGAHAGQQKTTEQ